MATKHVERIPKGMHHLELTVRSKFAAKYPSRAPHPSTAFVQPSDRIGRWNIVPGDKVRLIVGKPLHKWNDETEGKKSGWKVYTVNSVDRERNRVFLDGLTIKKRNPTQPIPDNIETADEATRRSFTEQQNSVDTRRPVNYSNVQLCVEEAGKDSVFATRISTSTPHFQRETRRWHWQRFAAKLSGPSSVVPDAERDQVRIPWPKHEKAKPKGAGPYDTDDNLVAQSTLLLGAIPNHIVPTSLRAPAPADQGFSDEYIFVPGNRTHAMVEAAMPLYLSEELSPRFSRAKQTRGWNLRREAERAAREEVSRDAVEDWELQGRDAGLESVLELDAIGLEGVSIRSRTRKEVREGAVAELNEEIDAQKHAVARARADGKVWNADEGDWEEGEKGKKLAFKRARKERKERRMLEKLERLTLSDGKNMVVPKELRQI